MNIQKLSPDPDHICRMGLTCFVCTEPATRMSRAMTHLAENMERSGDTSCIISATASITFGTCDIHHDAEPGDVAETVNVQLHHAIGAARASINSTPAK